MLSPASQGTIWLSLGKTALKHAQAKKETGTALAIPDSSASVSTVPLDETIKELPSLGASSEQFHSSKRFRSCAQHGLRSLLMADEVHKGIAVNGKVILPRDLSVLLLLLHCSFNPMRQSQP